MIKGADKRCAVVVSGLDDYCKEAYDQLGDDSVYTKKIERDPVESLSKLADKKLIVLKEKGFIYGRKS